MVVVGVFCLFLFVVFLNCHRKQFDSAMVGSLILLPYTLIFTYTIDTCVCENINTFYVFTQWLG